MAEFTIGKVTVHADDLQEAAENYARLTSCTINDKFTVVAPDGTIATFSVMLVALQIITKEEKE